MDEDNQMKLSILHTLSACQATPCIYPPGLGEGPSGRASHMVQSPGEEKLVYLVSTLRDTLYSTLIFY